MDERAGRALVSALIRSLAATTPRSDGAAALRSPWPGGTEDRTVPAAREWLARWRPARAAVAAQACSCAAGRCAICN
jgi:hypothetical protein